MKKLNQTQKALVEECKVKVVELARLQDEAYSELCERVECDSDWLFDYVFNSTIGDSTYDALAQEKLFE
jgi:hypothetical protein